MLLLRTFLLFLILLLKYYLRIQRTFSEESFDEKWGSIGEKWLGVRGIDTLLMWAVAVRGRVKSPREVRILSTAKR